jgi:hypothetical protein
MVSWNAILHMTNATKGVLMGFTNTVLGLAVAFHVTLTHAQQGAIVAVVNGLLTLWIALTFTQSNKRIDNPLPAVAAKP